jgi:hypothetical protein
LVDNHRRSDMLCDPRTQGRFSVLMCRLAYMWRIYWNLHIVPRARVSNARYTAKWKPAIRSLARIQVDKPPFGYLSDLGECLGDHALTEIRRFQMAEKPPSTGRQHGRHPRTSGWHDIHSFRTTCSRPFSGQWNRHRESPCLRWKRRESMEAGQNQNPVSTVSHTPLEIPQKTRDSHFPTASTTVEVMKSKKRAARAA